MIFNAIIQVPIVLIFLILSIIPDWTFPDSVATALDAFFNVMYSFDFIIPMVDIVAVGVLIFGFYTVLFTWKITLLMMALIRGGIRFDL